MNVICDPNKFPDSIRLGPVGPADARERAAAQRGLDLDLDKLAADLSRNRLEEMRAIARELTYGEMMELAAGLWESGGQKPLTDDALPVVLHRWSKG